MQQVASVSDKWDGTWSRMVNLPLLPKQCDAVCRLTTISSMADSEDAVSSQFDKMAHSV
jgi:hypothetical protein